MKQFKSIGANLTKSTLTTKQSYENQVGCGYCKKEKQCDIRDPKINKAKSGCKQFKHYQDDTV